MEIHKPYEKGKSNVIVFHPNDAVRNRVDRMVREHPLLYLVGSFRDPSEYSWRVPLEDPSNQVILMGGLPAPLGSSRSGEISLARRIKDENKNANIILINNPRQDPSVYKQMAHTPQIVGTLEIDDSSAVALNQTTEDAKKELKNYVDWCIEQGTLTQRLSVGIVGMGDIGSNIGRELVGKPWLDKLYWYSDSPAAFDKLAKGISSRKKVEHVESLRTMFHYTISPDIVIIARGKKRTDYSGDRGNIVWEDFPDTLNKVVPVLEQAEDQQYTGCILPFSNPPGAIQWIAHNWYGIPESKLSSVACDATRFKGFMLDAFGNKKHDLGSRLNIGHIDISVLGEHGVDIVPYWEAAQIKKKPLEEFLKMEGLNLDSTEKQLIKRAVIEHSLQNKQVATETGINAFDVANETARVLDMMAHFQQPKESVLYTNLDHYAQIGLYGAEAPPIGDPYLIMPVRVDYSGRVNISGLSGMQFKRNASAFGKSEIARLPEEVKAGLKKAIEDQAKYVTRARELLGR